MVNAAPKVRFAPGLNVKGTVALKVLAPVVVTEAVPVMITPPVGANVSGHSEPVVTLVVPLYCRVAATP